MYDHLTNEDLEREIHRLAGIESSNIYQGLAGYTVGESLDIAEQELESRQH